MLEQRLSIWARRWDGEKDDWECEGLVKCKADDHGYEPRPHEIHNRPHYVARWWDEVPTDADWRKVVDALRRNND